VTEGLARIFELFASFIAVGSARTLDDGVGAGILILLGVVPNDLII
jgi:hypothetical protein